jgi:ankyrin repeat protein
MWALLIALTADFFQHPTIAISILSLVYVFLALKAYLKRKYNTKTDRLYRDLLEYESLSGTQNQSSSDHRHELRKKIEKVLDEKTLNLACLRNGETLLTAFCRSGSVAIVKMLLDAGANVNRRNNFGQSALQAAIPTGNFEIVEMLIENGTHLDPAGTGTTKGRKVQDSISDKSPLPLAAAHGQLHIMQLLLDKGVEITQQVYLSALKRASQNRRNDAISFLHDHIPREISDCNSKDRDGQNVSVKNDQILNGHPENSSSSGGPEDSPGPETEDCDPTPICEPSKEAQLFEACERRDLSRCERLLDQGADPNVSGPKSQTPLFVASQSGNLPLVKLLLERGANPNLADHVLSTPLIIASTMGNRDIIEILLQFGALIDAQDKDGISAIMCAALYGRPDCVDLLAEEGANVNLVGKKKETALINATKRGDVSSVERLLKCGADYSVKDSLGKTALAWAREKNFLEVEIIILEYTLRIGRRR